MKQNALYFAILCLLLGVTYYYHESGDVRREAAFLRQHQLFRPDKLGELQGFQNKVISLIKKEESFYLKEQDFLADERQFESLSRALSQIQAVRFLEKHDLEEIDLEMIFPRPDDRLKFTFSHGEVEYLIGEKLAFDQTFYLQIRWRYQGQNEDQVQTVVAKDASPDEGIHFQETYHLSDQKYRRLLALLYLDHQVFSERRPFAHLSNQALSRISVINQRNRPYTVSFLKAVTEPPAPHENVRYSVERFSTWIEEIAALSAQRVAFFDMTQPDQAPLARLVMSTEKEEVEWRIYEGTNPKEVVLISSTLPQVSFIFESSPQIFFLPSSYFWIKLPEQHDVAFLSSVPEQEAQAMMELFSREADSLEAMDRWKNEEQRTRLSYADKRFVVYSYESELQLWDTRDSLVYRYWQK